MEYNIHTNEPQTAYYVADQVWRQYATPGEKRVALLSVKNGNPFLTIGSESYAYDMFEFGNGRTYFGVSLENPNRTIILSEPIDDVTGTIFSVKSEKPRDINFDEDRLVKAVDLVREALG